MSSIGLNNLNCKQARILRHFVPKNHVQIVYEIKMTHKFPEGVRFHSRGDLVGEELKGP